MNIFEKLENETVVDFILRLAELKKEDKSITWQSIADCLNINFGVEKSEAWVRSEVKKHSVQNDSNNTACLEELNNAILNNTLELKKERVKLSDERIQNNAYIRKLSREETIKEIAFKCAKEMSSKKLLSTYLIDDANNLKNSNKEAILCISDWHYGLDFKNPWNTFSPEVCVQRVNRLKNKAIEYINQHKCKVVHLANLQDLIAGRIHLGLRLESRYDVISQTIHVSEILAEFISDLSKYAKVKYYDCLDNHSRLEPNKNDAQDLETLARIIPWYLKERLISNGNVEFCENEFGYDLITFETMGYKVICNHGDKDPIKNIDHLSMMTEQHYDLLLTAHMHHFQADEKNRTIALSNGTLMGVDGYAQKLRLSSTPSQNLIIVSKENPTECIYRILL